MKDGIDREIPSFNADEVHGGHSLFLLGFRLKMGKLHCGLE